MKLSESTTLFLKQRFNISTDEDLQKLIENKEELYYYSKELEDSIRLMEETDYLLKETGNHKARIKPKHFKEYRRALYEVRELLAGWTPLVQFLNNIIKGNIYRLE